MCINSVKETCFFFSEVPTVDLFDLELNSSIVSCMGIQYVFVPISIFGEKYQKQFLSYKNLSIAFLYHLLLQVQDKIIIESQNMDNIIMLKYRH